MAISASVDRVAHAIRRKSELVGQVGWITGGFAVQQMVRLGTNVILAWLLAPALLGTMLLINTLRTGGELLSDVGISSSVVNNARGREPGFLNTAWTVKVVRGFVLFIISVVVTFPLAQLYDDPQLLLLLPVSALIFIVSGFASPARYVLQKDIQVRRLVLFDLIVSIASLLIHVTLVLIWPTIWALVGGLLLAAIVSTVGSFYLVPGMALKFEIERSAFREIVSFGKWIFLGSVVYYLAMNFDRLYFADAIPYAILGIYGIARNFADTLLQIFRRAGNMLIFPKISGSSMRDVALRAKLGPMRWLLVCGTALVLALAVTFSDTFINIVYDDRYRAAGIYLAILLTGTWFAILGVIGDAMLMGVGKPATVATSNLAKLLLIAAALPLLMPRYGIIGALFLFAVAEAVRYGMLVWRKRRFKLSFLRQDFFATALFFALILVLRELTGLAGITSGIDGWIEAMRIANG